MRVHFFQHVAFEGPGLIEDWLRAKRYDFSVTRFYEDDFRLPDINDIDSLIVMGGPMGVYDDLKYRWLSKEKNFIKACIERGIKVIGVCLGAQLIADVLGAKVHVAPQKEIGWYPVVPTGKCRKYPWFYSLFQEHPYVFHWHGDQFEIPDNSENLLDSPANTNQAFIFGDSVIGLQFHIEVQREHITKMIASCPDDLDKGEFVQNASTILSQSKYTETTRGILKNLLDAFLN